VPKERHDVQRLGLIKVVVLRLSRQRRLVTSRSLPFVQSLLFSRPVDFLFLSSSLRDCNNGTEAFHARSCTPALRKWGTFRCWESLRHMDFPEEQCPLRRYRAGPHVQQSPTHIGARAMGGTGAQMRSYSRRERAERSLTWRSERLVSLPNRAIYRQARRS